MRQLGCMSADVYCQITNNYFYTTPSFLYWNRKKGKKGQLPERQRERECERWRVAENGVGVRCKNGRWKKDYVFVRNYFNGEERSANIH